MSLFLIGDVQGCHAELDQLLNKMTPADDDQLWFCGDLVGRGSGALEAMRLITSLPNTQTVLGNHDLHLLAIAAGVRAAKPSLRLEKLLDDKRLPDYLDWLRNCPFALTERDISLVHASAHPDWTCADLLTFSGELQSLMQSDDYARLLRDMYSDQPCEWSQTLRGGDRQRCLLNIFTRARYYFPDGRLNLTRDDTPSDDLGGDIPWYELSHRRDRQKLLFFGHWSALADYNIERRYGVHHLDKGCVWGGRMYGVRIDWRDPPAATNDNPEPSARSIRSFSVPSKH